MKGPEVNHPKVSVLTPIYNVEKYLAQCLESLSAQTLADIEFICINDGSTDGSRDILARFEGDGRFKVIDKPNSGYGASMNQGLTAACGEYVGIVESDDYVDARCFESLYELAEANGKPDIVKADHYRLFADGREERKHNFPEEICGKVLSPLGEQGAAFMLSTPAIWAALYKRDMLERDGIRFLESPGAAFQDTGFVMKSWIAANSVYLADEAFLHYRTLNQGSSSASSSKVYCVCDEMASIDEFMARYPEREPKLAPILAAKRLRTYWWNIKRISPADREEFAKRAAGEFRSIEERNLWEKAPLTEAETKRLARWMADPLGFALDLNVRELKKQGKAVPLGMKIRRKLHAR